MATMRENRTVATKKPDDEREVLRKVAARLRFWAEHAERIANNGDSSQIRSTLTRARRAFGEVFELDREVDVRMHFTRGVFFYAAVMKNACTVDRKSARKKALEFVKQMRCLSSRRFDLDLVTEAIFQNATSPSKRCWKPIVAAWGRHDLGLEAWRVEWSRWAPPAGDDP